MGHHGWRPAGGRHGARRGRAAQAAFVLIPVRSALLVALAALVVAGVAFSVYVLTVGEAAQPSAADRFVADVRARPVPDSLRRTSDDDLVALGERFCQALRDRGSSLAVLFEDQLAGRVYDGQTEVVAAAKRHLCPTVPDRDRSL